MANFKIIVYAPIESAEFIRKKLNELGAGNVGHYDYASFSSVGIGRFRPLEGSQPAVGTIGKMEEVKEEKIETVIRDIDELRLKQIYVELKNSHPYEEPGIEVIELKNL